MFGSDHLQIVRIVKVVVAGLAVVLPVAPVLHVLLSGAARQEDFAASLAAESRVPVAQAVHVLPTCMLGAEEPGTSFALDPVAFVVKMVEQAVLVPEGVLAARALEWKGHFGRVFGCVTETKCWRVVDNCRARPNYEDF
jgi:hypothetical protein